MRCPYLFEKSFQTILHATCDTTTTARVCVGGKGVPWAEWRCCITSLMKDALIRIILGPHEVKDIFDQRGYNSLEWFFTSIITRGVEKFKYHLLCIVDMNFRASRYTTFSPTPGYDGRMGGHATSCSKNSSSSMHATNILWTCLRPYLHRCRQTINLREY